MPEWGDEERDGEDRPGGRGLLAASLRLSAHILEREQDRWFLWLPMLFAGGIITYFALTDEPAARVALAPPRRRHRAYAGCTACTARDCA